MSSREILNTGSKPMHHKEEAAPSMNNTSGTNKPMQTEKKK